MSKESLYYERKAKDCWMRAAQKAEKEGKYLESATAYENVGEKEKARKCWLREVAEKEEKARSFLDFECIVTMYKRLGDIEKAVKFLKEAARKAEAEKNYFFAGKYYKRIGETMIEIAKKSFEKAAEIEEAKGNYWTAAEFYEEAGKKKKARECWKKAAELKENRGQYLEAARRYKRARAKEEAKRCLEERAEKCLKKGDYSGAAEACNQMGEINIARTLWKIEAKIEEEKGNYYYAMCYYRGAGMWEKAEECKGKYAEEEAKAIENDRIFWKAAAKYYKEAGEIEKAIELLKRDANEAEAAGNYSSAAMDYEELSQILKQ